RRLRRPRAPLRQGELRNAVKARDRPTRHAVTRRKTHTPHHAPRKEIQMKAFATIGLGSLGSISFQHAISALPADRPHGVAPDSWVRLDEKVGLVICAQRPGA